jgi:CHAD domain-containing protein
MVRRSLDGIAANLFEGMYLSMATAVLRIYPVQNLKQAFAALGAAALLCLADPKKKAVHALRTSVRRVEAQLELLALLPTIPMHEYETHKVQRLLRKLRRAAGRVRDLDVQRDLVAQEAKKLSERADLQKNVRDEARQLNRLLKRRRKNEAKRLSRKLHKQQSQLPITLEKLADVLKPAESLSLNQKKLIRLAGRVYARDVPAAPDPQDIEAMHRLRKRAKLARYLAETAPPSAHTAHRLAEHFETLQKAGGTWHDWFLLSGIADEELGRSTILSQNFRNNSKRTSKAFQKRIQGTAR